MRQHKRYCWYSNLYGISEIICNIGVGVTSPKYFLDRDLSGSEAGKISTHSKLAQSMKSIFIAIGKPIAMKMDFIDCASFECVEILPASEPLRSLSRKYFGEVTPTPILHIISDIPYKFEYQQ